MAFSEIPSNITLDKLTALILAGTFGVAGAIGYIYYQSNSPLPTAPNALLDNPLDLELQDIQTEPLSISPAEATDIVSQIIFKGGDPSQISENLGLLQEAIEESLADWLKQQGSHQDSVQQALKELTAAREFAKTPANNRGTVDVRRRKLRKALSGLEEALQGTEADQITDTSITEATVAILQSTYTDWFQHWLSGQPQTSEKEQATQAEFQRKYDELMRRATEEGDYQALHQAGELLEKEMQRKYGDLTDEDSQVQEDGSPFNPGATAEPESSGSD